ncbi:MAG: hypothetical protein AB7T31_09860 [Gemmatimonadales bacterium]
MRRAVRTLVLVTMMATTACYTYVPVSPAATPQGTQVRARLSRMSQFELAQITVNNIDEVEGEVVQLDGSELVLSATWLQAITGNGYAGNGWTVRIPEVDVAGFEQKKVSWWRTGVVVAGILAGTWLGFDALGIGPGGGGGGGSPGNEL